MTTHQSDPTTAATREQSATWLKGQGLDPAVTLKLWIPLAEFIEARDKELIERVAQIADNKGTDYRARGINTAFHVADEIAQAIRRATTESGYTKTEAWNLQLQADISRLHARISELEKALRPFVDAAVDVDDDAKDDWNIWESPCAMSITVGDLREAKRVLDEGKV